MSGGADGRDGLQAVATGLGWFSLALGAAELVAPGALSRSVGLGSRGLVRGYGLREVAVGVGLLTATRPEARAPWLWARVAGDVLDIATLALALHPANPRRRAAGVALAAVVGVTALDALCAVRLGERQRRPPPPRVDWSARSGFPRSANAMRGAASDFKAPADMREPPAPMRYPQEAAPVSAKTQTPARTQ